MSAVNCVVNCMSMPNAQKCDQLLRIVSPHIRRGYPTFRFAVKLRIQQKARSDIRPTFDTATRDERGDFLKTVSLIRRNV